MPDQRVIATYRVICERADIEARAEAIALEQSVELPLVAVRDAHVREEVVARVEAIRQCGERAYEIDIALAQQTMGLDAGQLMNMLFGNSSLHEDVTLVEADIAPALRQAFGGPRFGVDGLRDLTGVPDRPLSCTALKPQGLSPDALADLARTFAEAQIDIIKDDHGLADQAFAPFRERVRACAEAIAEANVRTGGKVQYAPSITGDLDAMRRQIDLARASGLRMVLIAPMVSGVSNLSRIANDAGVALLAHPALAGAARIAPPLLLGRLFRLFGADATIFPNSGGRFGYSQAQCLAIAAAAREQWNGIAPTMPVPAGGMSVDRVPEMASLFGRDTMLLIGGSLLAAGDALPERCRAFVQAVRDCRVGERNIQHVA